MPWRFVRGESTSRPGPRAGRGPNPNSSSALQCVGPSGRHELISFISPAGRMDFPPILRRRKLRTGERKPIAQVLQLRWAPTSSGGEGLPVTFPAGAWVGGPACPIPPGLALSPRPPPSPGRAAAAAGRQVTPAQARRVGQRGIAPASSQDPPERPLPGLALVVGGGQEGRDPPLRVEDGPGVWAGLAMPPTLLGGGPRQEAVGGPGQRRWHARVHAEGIPN